jgi:hypothetical protein
MRSPTPSETVSQAAREHLQALVGRLDEGHLSSVIDARIVRVLDRFGQLNRRHFTHERALRVAARFVRHVYRYAVPAPRTLSFAQAQEEAVALIVQGYANVECRGCDAAFDDVGRFGARGVVSVLEQLAELIRTRHRQAYLLWLANHYVDCVDWNTRCAMATLVLARYGDDLPPELARCPPEQLTPVLFALVQQLVAGGLHPARLGTADPAKTL